MRSRIWQGSSVVVLSWLLLAFWIADKFNPGGLIYIERLFNRPGVNLRGSQVETDLVCIDFWDFLNKFSDKNSPKSDVTQIHGWISE